MLKHIFRNACAAQQLGLILLLTATLAGESTESYRVTIAGTQIVREANYPKAATLGIPLNSLYSAANRVVTPPLDVEKLVYEDSTTEGFWPKRTGIVQEFPKVTMDDGLWTPLSNGGWLWTMAFQGTGAQGIKLRIAPWQPPYGLELVVYEAGNPDAAAGPFTRTYPASTDEFWTPTIYAEEVYVECYLPPWLDRAPVESSLSFDAVVNIYHNPLKVPPLDCHQDVTCHYPDWEDEAKGVVFIDMIVVGGNHYIASGALLARSPADSTLLLLTASHCKITEANVGNIWIVWLYESESCNSATINQETSYGGTILVDDPESDHQLLGLDPLRPCIPQGVTFLGWNSDPWDITEGNGATGIHHPQGSHKRISFGTSFGAKSGNDPKGCSHCYEIRYPDPENDGLIEEGSSGSPIFDEAQLVRGVCSVHANFPPACDKVNHVFYGRFDVAYDSLWPYLTPVDPIYVDVNYGDVEIGTETEPFNRVEEGTFAVRAGSNVYIKTGTYDEVFSVVKSMYLRTVNGPVTIGRPASK